MSVLRLWDFPGTVRNIVNYIGRNYRDRDYYAPGIASTFSFFHAHICSILKILMQKYFLVKLLTKSIKNIRKQRSDRCKKVTKIITFRKTYEKLRNKNFANISLTAKAGFRDYSKKFRKIFVFAILRKFRENMPFEVFREKFRRVVDIDHAIV